MTVEERRQAFVKNFSESPITLLQGSVGERIKRNFTHRDPAKPLKLCLLYTSTSVPSTWPSSAGPPSP